MSRPSVLTSAAGTRLAPREPGPAASGAPAAETRPEARRRQGQVLVVAGWMVAMVGVGLYGAACFAGDRGAEVGAIVLRGAVPAARAALLVVGGGTLLWIVGSVVRLNAELDAAYGDPGGREGRAPERGGSR